MPTGVIATGSKTIIDLSDGRSLSIYLGSNHPRTQIYDTNTTSFIPDWEGNDTALIITPTVYLDFRQVTNYSEDGVSIAWQRKTSSNSDEANVTSGQNDESINSNTYTLTVSKNKLSTSGAKWITYIANVTYTDQSGIEVTARADISFSLVQTGANSKLVWLSGEQAFKEITSDGGTTTYTPSSIELKANIQGVNGVNWFYKDSTGQLKSISNPGQTLTIAPGSTPGSTYFNGDSATIIVQAANDSSITDTLTIYKLRDGVNGAAGASAYTAFLTNESITFAGNSSGVVAGNTEITSNVVVYYGTTKQTLNNNSITVSGTPTGITVSKRSVSSGEVKITFIVNPSGSNLGSSGHTRGTINVTITDPVSITLPIYWNKVNSGADGEDAITFSVYSPDGNVFTNGVNEGGQNSLKLTTQFYKGSTDIKEDSNSLYTWYMYAPSDSDSDTSGWKKVQEEKDGTSQNKGYEYTVNASDVVGTSTYRCKARIGNTSTTYYSDTITILDKTDNYQAEIESTGGEIFKNSIGESFLICRLFQNGQEVDPVKSTTYVKTEPSSGTTGSYIYVVNGNNTTLKKRTSSGWTTETSDSERIYKWYKRDKDGNAVTVGGNSVFATGKVIYVNQNDVDSKAVFTCEVE